ncbi:MAG: hypothetical protein WCO60_20215 [Verrucomicrobiota bacterium]
MNKQALPTIHTNGNSGPEMLAAYETAHLAFQLFVKAFNQIDFNARNYYVNGDSAWTEAVAARTHICKNLKEAQDYLEEHLNHVFDQVNR